MSSNVVKNPFTSTDSSGGATSLRAFGHHCIRVIRHYVANGGADRPPPHESMSRKVHLQRVSIIKELDFVSPNARRQIHGDNALTKAS